MPQSENPSRERILTRIRTALRQSAPLHEPTGASTIFAPVTDPLDRFQKECAINGTECFLLPNLRAGAFAINNVLTALPAGDIFVQDSPDLRRLAMEWQKGRTIQWSTDGAPKESSQVTITLAEALVAQTGSVLVSAACGGRGASIIAPVHIVIATIDQLVPELSATLVDVQKRGTALQNSFLCLITGSSRTADIEKTLVMGAHGPRRLIVFLAKE